MIKKGDINIIGVYKGDTSISRIYKGDTLVFQKKDSFIPPKFPEYVDETSTFRYEKDDDYLEMKDGEVVESNMNLIIFDGITSGDYSIVNGLIGEYEELDLLTGQGSSYTVIRGTDLTTVYDIFTGAFSGQNTILFLVGNIDWSNINVFPDVKYLNCKHYRRDNFWSVGRLKNQKNLERVVCPDFSGISSNYSSMFEGCTNLKYVENMPNEIVRSCDKMFYNCSSLKNIYPKPYINIKKGSIADMFAGCKALEEFPVQSEINLNITDNKTSNAYGCRAFMDVGSESGAIGEVDITVNFVGNILNMFTRFSCRKLNLTLNCVQPDSNNLVPDYACIAGRQKNMEELIITLPSDYPSVTTYFLEAPSYLNGEQLDLKKLTVYNAIHTLKGNSFDAQPFNSNINNLEYIYLDWVGKCKMATLDMSKAIAWGTGSEENLFSVLYTLLINSDDLTLTDETQTINLSEATYDVLTADERNAIRAKGYILQRKGVKTDVEEGGSLGGDYDLYLTNVPILVTTFGEPLVSILGITVAEARAIWNNAKNGIPQLIKSNITYAACKMIEIALIEKDKSFTTKIVPHGQELNIE